MNNAEIFELCNQPCRQVMFWDSSNEKYIAGILHGKEIICGCCGAIFDINEVIVDAEADNKVAVRPLKWVDISEEIAGDWSEEEDD